MFALTIMELFQMISELGEVIGISRRGFPVATMAERRSSVSLKTERQALSNFYGTINKLNLFDMGKLMFTTSIKALSAEPSGINFASPFRCFSTLRHPF